MCVFVCRKFKLNICLKNDKKYLTLFTIIKVNFVRFSKLKLKLQAEHDVAFRLRNTFLHLDFGHLESDVNDVNTFLLLCFFKSTNIKSVFILFYFLFAAVLLSEKSILFPKYSIEIDICINKIVLDLMHLNLDTKNPIYTDPNTLF